MRFPLTCSCGHVYSASDWSRLPIAGPPEREGLQEVPADPSDPENPDAYLLRMRNCDFCNTTISVDTRDELAAGVMPPGHEKRDDDFIRRLTQALIENGVPVTGSRMGSC